MEAAGWEDGRGLLEGGTRVDESVTAAEEGGGGKGKGGEGDGKGGGFIPRASWLLRIACLRTCSVWSQSQLRARTDDVPIGCPEMLANVLRQHLAGAECCPLLAAGGRALGQLGQLGRGRGRWDLTYPATAATCWSRRLLIGNARREADKTRGTCVIG